MKKLKGECLCEAVRFTVEDAFRYALNCHCGSFLYSVLRGGKYVHVNLGSLLDTPSVRPTAHIYVSSKAPWHEIADNLPQHETLP